jgi:GDP-L-fucose synthase
MVSSLITKFHKAKTENQPSLELWGTGTPRRDLLYVKDLAKALIFLMQNYNSNEPINIGTGTDLEIKEIAEIIRETTDYRGQITFNPEKPDGMMKRQLDVSKINALGWNSETSFRNGIRKTYEWYLSTLSPSMPSHSPQHLRQN